MSKYVKNQDSNTAWVIDESNQVWTLGKNATISVVGEAAINVAVGSNDNVILLKGDLAASGAGSEGVRMEGDGSALTVAKTSLITAESGIVNTSAGGVIRNAGEIDGVDHAIVSNTEAGIRNKGLLSGDAAVTAVSGSTVLNLKSGVIDGETTGIRLSGNEGSTVVNHGLVRSDNAAITVSSMEDSFLTNTGKIIGNVTMGNGDDRIDTTEGRIKGQVAGGSGDDIYMIGKGAGELVEKLDSGKDKVYASVSHTLGDNFESLYLTGTRSAKATGNDAHNIVYGNDGDNKVNGKAGNDFVGGNGGDDLLKGGLGNDDFVFNKGDGHDTVCDFELGGDDVALLGFGLDSYAELAPFLSQHGDDTWIALGDGDRVILENVAMDDLTDDMFIFSYVAAA